jgi:ATP-dependent helicase/nuclease subunit B
VDRHAECRLSYFLKYGLRAKERKEYTVDPAEFGTYVHDVLEHTAKDVMELGGFEKVSLEQTISIARDHSDAYAAEHFAQLDSQRLDYLFRRNWRELEMVVQELWEELKESKFRPEAFELSFGDDGEMPAIEVENAAIRACLRGFVDRVDLWKTENQHYFRVVDYKTGKKDFDYCDVFNGVGLQMLLYLFALEKSGMGVPSGVQYFPARVPLVSADGRLTDEEARKARQKEWKRKGLLLADEEVLQAMEPGEEISRLSCTRKKDGSLSGDLADREQLKLLRQYVFGLLGNMVNEIASGNIAPNPYTRGSSHSACAFCPYGAICHESQVAGRRNYEAMKPDRFWQEIGKEMNPDG